MRIGHITLANRLFAAPMAGVTDRPFRMLCKKLGAGYAVSEMVTSRRELWNSLKTSRRADHRGVAAVIRHVAVLHGADLADQLHRVVAGRGDTGGGDADLAERCGERPGQGDGALLRGRALEDLASW